jgi:AcrR family transcriptional regulator
MLRLPMKVNCFILIAMKPQTNTQQRKTGRPLSFDREAALHQAMLLFWRHGYEGTSLSDLTAAMGVTPPSIYAAFGDKRTLFLEAVARYASGPVTAESIILNASSSRDAAWGLLHSSAIAFTGFDTPPGCLLATAAISCSAAAQDVQPELTAIRDSIGASLRRKIAEDIAAERLPALTDADALAGFIMAVIQGMSTLARDGASREKLLRIASVAIAAWPRSLGP